MSSATRPVCLRNERDCLSHKKAASSLHALACICMHLHVNACTFVHAPCTWTCMHLHLHALRICQKDGVRPKHERRHRGAKKQETEEHTPARMLQLALSLLQQLPLQ